MMSGILQILSTRKHSRKTGDGSNSDMYTIKSVSSPAYQGFVVHLTLILWRFTCVCFMLLNVCEFLRVILPSRVHVCFFKSLLQ